MVTSQSERELLSHLSALKDAELLYERGIYPQSIYIFKHALTQEVVYNSLLLKRKKEIHERIGKVLEEISTERLEEFYEILATHYSKSDNSGKAFQYLKLAGNKATRNYSNWEAFRSYKDAINVLNQLPETEENKKEKLEVFVSMTLPMASLGFPEDSLEILQEGEKLSKHFDDTRNLALLQSLMGIYYMHKGKALVGIKYSELAFKEPRKTGDIELMAPIARGLCASYCEVGEFRKTTEVAPDVIDLIEKKQIETYFFGAPFNAYSLLCVYFGTSLAMLGDFDKGEAICERGLRVGVALNHLVSLAPTELMYGLLYTTKGDGRNAIKHFKNAIKYMEKGEIVLVLGLAWFGLGCGYHYLGDLETARKYMEKGLNITLDAGVQWWRSFHYWYLSKIHFDLGDPKNARSYIEEALKTSQKNNEKHIEGASWIWSGRLLGRADPSRADKAEESILKGIKILEELQIKPWYAQGRLYLGEFYCDSGRSEKALKNLKTVKGMFREMGMDYWLTRTQEVLGRL